MNGQRAPGLFGLLDGFPAQLAVVVGLLLVLLAAVLPSCVAAGAAGAAGAVERAERLMEMDLEQMQEQQTREREMAVAQAAATGQAPDATMEQRHRDALRAQREQLKTQYGIAQLRRDAVEASASARGPRVPFVLDCAGRLLLVLGLLVLAFCAEGTRQMVLAAALVVVLLGSLAGLSVEVGMGRPGGVELRLPDFGRLPGAAGGGVSP